MVVAIPESGPAVEPVSNPQDDTIRAPIPLEDLRDVVLDQSMEAADLGSDAETIAERLGKRKTGHHAPDAVREALDALANAAGELEWALDCWCDELNTELDQ
jgi:hypothetical protein